MKPILAFTMILCLLGIAQCGLMAVSYMGPTAQGLHPTIALGLSVFLAGAGYWAAGALTRIES